MDGEDVFGGEGGRKKAKVAEVGRQRDSLKYCEVRKADATLSA